MYEVAPEIASLVQEKQQADDVQFAELVKSNLPVAPIHTGLDGGMNRVFLAQVGGQLPPARVAPPTVGGVPEQPGPVVTVDNGGTAPTLASQVFGGLFGSHAAAQPAQVATSEPAEPAAAPRSRPASAPRNETASTASVAKPKPAEVAKTTKPEPQEIAAPQQTATAKPKPAAQQEANAAAPPAGSMSGAQPRVPAGSFDSRWGGLQ